MVLGARGQVMFEDGGKMTNDNELVGCIGYIRKSKCQKLNDK